MHGGKCRLLSDKLILLIHDMMSFFFLLDFPLLIRSQVMVVNDHQFFYDSGRNLLPGMYIFHYYIVSFSKSCLWPVDALADS